MEMIHNHDLMGTVLIPGAGSQDKRYHCHPALKMRKQAPGGGRTPGSRTVEGINQHPPHHVACLQAPQRSLASKSQTCPLSKASICVRGFPALPERSGSVRHKPQWLPILRADASLPTDTDLLG